MVEIRERRGAQMSVMCQNEGCYYWRIRATGKIDQRAVKSCSKEKEKYGSIIKKLRKFERDQFEIAQFKRHKF